jgi:hypothetical protein
LRTSRERFGVRVVHFSIQGTHLHLLLEAQGARALSRVRQAPRTRVRRPLPRGHPPQPAAGRECPAVRARESPAPRAGVAARTLAGPAGNGTRSMDGAVDLALARRLAAGGAGQVSGSRALRSRPVVAKPPFHASHRRRLPADQGPRARRAGAGRPQTPHSRSKDRAFRTPCGRTRRAIFPPHHAARTRRCRPPARPAASESHPCFLASACREAFRLSRAMQATATRIAKA